MWDLGKVKEVDSVILLFYPDPDRTSQDKPDPDPDPTSQDKPDPDPDPDTSVLKIFHLFYDEF